MILNRNSWKIVRLEGNPNKHAALILAVLTFSFVTAFYAQQIWKAIWSRVQQYYIKVWTTKSFSFQSKCRKQRSKICSCLDIASGSGFLSEKPRWTSEAPPSELHKGDGGLLPFLATSSEEGCAVHVLLDWRGPLMSHCILKFPCLLFPSQHQLVLCHAADCRMRSWSSVHRLKRMGIC